MNTPFYSVVVLCYNTAETVVETLESIKGQTFRDIELIICDDASADGSVEICRRWIDDNGDRFSRALLMTADRNRGTAANADRGCREARGQWLKVIAADDCLLPTGLEEYKHFIDSHADSDILFSKMTAMGDMTMAEHSSILDTGKYFSRLTRRQLEMRLLKGNFLPAASALIRRDCYDRLGGYEMSVALMEDWPFWVKAILNGCVMRFYDGYTAAYRFSQHSISMSEMHERRKAYLKTDRAAHDFVLRLLRSKHRYCDWYYQLTYYHRTLQPDSMLWRALYRMNVLNPVYYEDKRYKKIEL